jgi:hypothetical protein
MTAMTAMTRASKWIAVAGCVVVLVAAAGRMRPSQADDAPPPRERPVAEGDAAGRLDRLIEKLDRVADRMESERRGPPDRPPHRMPPGPGGPREHREHGEHPEHGDYHRPGDHIGPPPPGPRGPGIRGEGRRGPMGDMPPEMREMLQKRMQEAQRRMEQARDKFKELEERVKKLEAEVERLKSA